MSRLLMNPRLLALLLTSAGFITACGGGGGGSATSPTPSTVSGTISGLGSVILNGTRYETIGASVKEADDDHLISTPLGVGMTVRIQPSATSASTADTIYVQRGIQGSTSAVNSAASSLNVAGMPVITDASTLIMTSAGAVGSFTDLQNSQVEVYGLPQSDGTFKATRIEVKATAPNVQLVGVVSNLNTSNKTFTLGNASNTVTVSYSAVTPPTGLVNGAVVAVHTGTTTSASNYAATSLYLRATDSQPFTQYETDYAGTSGIRSERNELYGMVSGLATSAGGCTLQVQGIPTTLTSAALCASIQNGDYVEVKGVLTNGTLAASRIEFKTAGSDRALNGYSDDANDSDHDGLKHTRLLTSNDISPVSRSYEIYGTLSNCSASTCTLTSNGTAFTADLSTAVWEHGAVTSGLVEAKGYMTSATTFKATKVEAKH